MLTALFCGGAFLAGVTGAWSPCGFSVVDTLGRGRELGGRRLVLASCATFTAGALAGGAFTFGVLALAGSWLSGDVADAAFVAAALIAVAAAAGELRDVRIVPQVRRQVPEPWRRTMPLPLAAALYGVLLGLGFMTFVLTLAFWSLAVVSLAVGDLTTGALAGLAFGLGRALPVAAMAPRYRGGGGDLQTLMCEKPALLRRLRLADGAMLVAVAVALALAQPTGEAQAATLFAGDAADASTGANGDLAWRRPSGGAILLSGGSSKAIAGDDVAIGGGLIAIREGAVTNVYDRATVAASPTLPVPVVVVSTPDASAIAVSANWLVWRSSRPGVPEALLGARIGGGTAAQLAVAVNGEQYSRPSIDGDRLVYARATTRTSSIVLTDLANGASKVLRFSRTTTQLRGPSISGENVLYIAAHACWQRLVLTTAAAPSTHSTLWRAGATARRDRGHERGRTTQGNRATKCPRPRRKPVSFTLSSTAFDGKNAYVTLLQPGAIGRPATASLSHSVVTP